MNFQQNVDSDLQKAIDDITKTTNQDPIFADPVAAPVDVTASQTQPNIADPTFATAGIPGVDIPMPAPEMPAPEMAMPDLSAMAAPAAPEMPASFAPASPIMPEAPIASEAPVAPIVPEAPAMPEVPAVPAPAPEAPEAPVEEEKAPIVPEAPGIPFLDTESLGKDQVKEAALRSLAPIADKLDISPSRKFEIYKNVIDNYQDTSVLESAYHAASEIEDERERGDALLYLVDSIDKM